VFAVVILKLPEVVVADVQLFPENILLQCDSFSRSSSSYSNLQKQLPYKTNLIHELNTQASCLVPKCLIIPHSGKRTSRTVT